MNVVSLLVLLCVPGLPAKPTAPSIFAVCRQAEPGPPEDPKWVVLEFVIFFRNNGNADIEVPTAGYRSNGEHDYTTSERSMFQHLIWDFSRDSRGEMIVPSRSELHVAVLKPGEVARITWKSNIYIPGKLARVGVDLKVEDEFAKRFGLWSGYVRADNIEVDP